MKSSWPVKKLGEILELCDSGTWGKETSGGFPLLRSSNMQEGKLVLNDLKFIDVPINQRDRFTLSEGDILVTKSSGSESHIGKSLYINKSINGKYGFSNFTQRLRINRELADPLYIYFIFSSHSTREALLNASRTTSGLRNLSIPALKEFNILFPPLIVQKKIMERLDSIRKAQELCDQQIQKTEELFESLLYSSYSHKEGNPLKNIRDGATLRGGYAFKSEDFISEGIQVIRMGNIKRDSIDLSASPAFLPEEFVNKYPNYTLQHGDIIISMTGTVGKEDYGNVAIIEEDQELLLNQRVGKFVINSDVFKPIYFYYFCQTENFRKQVFSLGKGVRQANISGSQIESIKIPVLTIKEQQKIVEKLEGVQNYKKLLLKQKSLLKELFDSVLDKSMKGELVN